METGDAVGPVTRDREIRSLNVLGDVKESARDDNFRDTRDLLIGTKILHGEWGRGRWDTYGGVGSTNFTVGTVRGLKEGR